MQLYKIITEILGQL